VTIEVAMMTKKPTMLIAEDSDTLAPLFVNLFSDDFDVVLAQDGAQAVAIIDKTDRFDVCVIDCIMPVESPKLALADADETGLRLIRYILERQKCSRFVVLSIRWDLEEKLESIIPDRTAWTLLLKQDTDSDGIRTAVARLIDTDGQEN